MVTPKHSVEALPTLERTKVISKEDKNTQLIGNSLVRLCLECIKVWAHSSFEFGENNPFEKVYDILRGENINFPSNFVYFPKFKMENKEKLSITPALKN